jgi:eukaryotic-like serine/threonine-protein kinase
MTAYASWDAGGAPELETLMELGEGGMAVAYLARTLGAGGFQRLVVLKRLGQALAGSRSAVERFLVEARIAASVHHSNVVGTHQVGRDEAGPYIVLDYVEGGSLDDLVQAASERRSSVPLPVLLRIALDALHGLRAVHDARDTEGRPLHILHRDVSLQNVLVGVRDGVARLADFGVAKSAFTNVQTSPGYLVGKLFYFSPEYLQRKPTGPTLDLYALGVMLWLAIAGEDPWTEDDEHELVRLIIEEGLPPLPNRAQIAPEIGLFVMTACQRDPACRYQSAREMAAVLEGFDRERGWLATHGEVAEVVADLLGPKLERRREFIAQLAPQIEQTRVRKLELAATRPESGRVAAQEVAPSHARARSGEKRRFFNWQGAALGAAAVALFLAGALAFASIATTATPTVAPPVVDVPQRPAPSALTSQPAVPSVFPLESALPDEAAPSAAASDGAAPARSAEPATPARPARAAPSLPPPRERPSAAPAASATAPPFSSPDIQKRNPYR